MTATLPSQMLLTWVHVHAAWAAFKPQNSSRLRTAIVEWGENTTLAKMQYGPMNLWDVSSISDMKNSFFSSLINEQLDAWNTGSVTTMEGMFWSASAFNQQVNSWNIGSVTTMENMFWSASAFNQQLNAWNISSVITMVYMFRLAFAFNQPVGDWNTCRVATFETMFYNASAFNQPIGTWCTRSVPSTLQMFYLASAFHQYIGDWKGLRSGNMAMIFYGSPVKLCAPYPQYLESLIQWMTLGVSFLAGCWFLYAHRQSRLTQSRLSRYSFELNVPWSPVKLDDIDPTSVGRDLHMRVGPERWCITKQDLHFFEKEVRAAWKAGKIPNGTGKFHNPFHHDPSIGPTMYQVNEHYIKPVTARFGGMSFALMLHPDGLECDCFATHAWAEGIFEFCDKLRRGWPPRCQNMYICFLANPQNLNISRLLDVEIEESPFAIALSKATHMVVVPNRFVSIYTRLWCCYEAYVAFALNKTIVLPPGRVLIKWTLYRYAICLVVIIIAYILSSFILWHRFSELRNILHHRIAYFRRANYILTHGREYRYLNAREAWTLLDGPATDNISIPSASAPVPVPFGDYRSFHVGFTVSAVIGNVLFCVMLAVASCWTSGRSIFAAWLQILAALVVGVSIYGTQAYYCLYSTMTFPEGFFLFSILAASGAAVFACLIVFILRCRTEEARRNEAIELQYDCLTAATCSDEGDKEKILTAIRGKEADVEAALDTLKQQGMSTVEMRARRKSDHASSQGYTNLAAGTLAMLMWLLYLVHLYFCGVSVSFDNMHRTHTICGVNGIIACYILCWSWVTCDADLFNLIQHASLVGCFFSIVCGLLFGFWGIPGGTIFAVYYLLISRDRVQRMQLQYLSEFLVSVTHFCYAYLTSELLLIAVVGAPCAYVWHEVAGTSVWFLVLRIFIRAVRSRLSLERFLEVTRTMFLVWCSANCLLVAYALHLLTEFRFFLIDESALQTLFPLEFHFVWSVVCMSVVAIFNPIVFLLWEWSRWRQTRRTRNRETSEIELSMIEHGIS